MQCKAPGVCNCPNCLKVISRKEAADSGLKRFYTGRPCGYGHDSARYTASGNCVMCASKSSSSYAKSLKAARFAQGMTKYTRMVPTELVDTLDAVVEASRIGQSGIVSPIPPGKWACKSCSYVNDTPEVFCPGCGEYESFISGVCNHV
jgi:Zn finger protein HypA/HybF involved in hydrogenase expression